ncbi:type IV toxin-antitoxin system AbiEi family antitoxin [Mycolicibacterium sp. Y3]
MNLYPEPFLGSEAVAAGTLKKHQLRSGFRSVLPNVYVSRDLTLTTALRAKAAWLWSHRQGVVAGRTAAALHGAKWIDAAAPVELIWGNARAPAGVRTRAMSLRTEEVCEVAGLPVTTPERTAFDLGRRGPLQHAVAALDALCRAAGCRPDDIVEVASYHPGVRGLRLLERVVALVDPGAQSPKETWLRLLLIDDGLPAPVTQIPVFADDGYVFAYLDMGWPEFMIAVEYDGDQHRTERWQYVKDIRRIAELERLGWIVVRVVSEDHPREVLRRVRAALAQRQSGLR